MVLDGDVPEVLAAAFLIALKMKGETGDEIAGCARAMRRRARALKLGVGGLLDTCGTGGDNAGTFNISTGAALIAAAAGVPVAKHGNRAISGKVGGADVLEKLRHQDRLRSAGAAQMPAGAGCCFIFAPAYHPAMARLAPLRRTLATRTLFNLMGPLVNPALPSRQVTGVAEAQLFEEVARAIAVLGTDHAMVVHGLDGLDEISISAETKVAEIRGESISDTRSRPSNSESSGPGAAAFAPTMPTIPRSCCAPLWWETRRDPRRIYSRSTAARRSTSVAKPRRWPSGVARAREIIESEARARSSR